MMQILYLPGFSIRSKEEAIANTSALKAHGHEVYIHEWRHWENQPEIFFSTRHAIASEVKWDPEKEVEIIKSRVDLDSEILIISKSIGTFIAVNLIPIIKIRKLVLMGIPINDLDAKELGTYSNLYNLDASITVIQNRNDEHGTSDQVKELLKDLEYKLIVKEASDHRYNYPEIILQIVNNNAS